MNEKNANNGYSNRRSEEIINAIMDEIGRLDRKIVDLEEARDYYMKKYREKEQAGNTGTFMWHRDGNRFQVHGLGIVYSYDCGHVWLESKYGTAPEKCPVCKLIHRVKIYEEVLTELSVGNATPIDPEICGSCYDEGLSCYACIVCETLNESGYFPEGAIKHMDWVKA